MQKKPYTSTKEFANVLKGLSADRLGDIAEDFEQISIYEEPALRKRDLPKELPADVRDEILTLSLLAFTANRKVASMLDRFHMVAADAWETTEEKEMANAPRCDLCRQKLPAKKSSRR